MSSARGAARSAAAASALVLAAAFGAVDQYLGSRISEPWSGITSLSAPWLVLAFAAGCTQQTVRRATVLGLGSTFAALLGYLLLTDSPIEGAQYSVSALYGFLVSNAATVAGGFLTGPLLGWLGYRWRAHRSVLGALVAVGSLCLEPLAHHLRIGPIEIAGRGYVLVTPIPSSSVAAAEIVAGLLLATYFGASLVRTRSA